MNTLSLIFPWGWMSTWPKLMIFPAILFPSPKGKKGDMPMCTVFHKSSLSIATVTTSCGENFTLCKAWDLRLFEKGELDGIRSEPLSGLQSLVRNFFGYGLHVAPFEFSFSTLFLFRK
jgi:hypothetical protein